MIFTLIYVVVLLASQWRVYQKMGRQGWEGIIPGYNLYILFDILYNAPMKFLTLLIPGYNIYVLVRFSIDLAHRFNKSSGFGVGMAFLAPIFWAILGFGPAQYLDGSQAVQGTDSISQFLDKTSEAVDVFTNDEKPAADEQPTNDEEPVNNEQE
jgi:hypothetical protein